MGLFNKLFGTQSVIFWRQRAETAESKFAESEKLREREKERHRLRESLLIDEIVILADRKPIHARVEKELDVGGFEQERQTKIKTDLEKKQLERETIEKKAFIESSVAAGKTQEEAENYWKTNKAEILNQKL